MSDLLFATMYWIFIFALSLRVATITNLHVEAFTTPQWRSCRSNQQHYRTKSATKLQFSNNSEENDPRDNFGRSIRGLQSSALKTTIGVGDTVVCKRSLPNLGIYENSSYEVTSIYSQYFDEETQQIVKQPLSSIDDTTQNSLYMTLFSPQHHSEAVVVTPGEVGLITVREELGNAAWLAVPGFFWIFVAASFYNTYHERTGGTFSDAFWGRWWMIGVLFVGRVSII